MNKSGKVGQTLKPGQSGTLYWLKKYGERLMLVRYRYDRVRRVRMTTIELLVDETPWMPPHEQTVFVEIHWEEEDLRNRAKSAGGRWNAGLRRWELTREAAKRLGLENRLDN